MQTHKIALGELYAHGHTYKHTPPLHEVNSAGQNKSVGCNLLWSCRDLREKRAFPQPITEENQYGLDLIHRMLDRAGHRVEEPGLVAVRSFLFLRVTEAMGKNHQQLAARPIWRQFMSFLCS